MSDRQENEVLFHADRTESAVDRVLNLFKETLIMGRLKPGDRLPSEPELSRQLSVSRGSVREAMKVLSAFGIVEIRRGNGTYIAQSDHKVVFDPLLFSLILSNAETRELVELRELMEFALVKQIIANATGDDMANIEKTIFRMEELIGNYEENGVDHLVQSDLDFHKALGKAANNVLVEKIYAFVMDLFTPRIRVTHENQRSGEDALAHHRKIHEALKRRNVDDAIAAVEGSIVAWKDLSRYTDRDGGGPGRMIRKTGV